MSRLYLSILVVVSLQSAVLAQRWEFTGGPGGDPLTSMTVGPNGELYVLSNALHRSTDKGATWTRLAHELTLATGSIGSKLACGKDGVLVLATPSGVWKSADNGITWLNVFSIRPRSTSEIAITAKGTVLFSLADSLLISSDEGVTWRRESRIGSGKKLVFLDSCDNIFLGGDYYSWRSTNQGASWSRLLNGYTQSNMFAMVALSKRHLLAVAYADMFLSSDSGRTWMKTFTHNTTSGPVGMVAINKDNIFFIDRSGRNIVKSTDMGYTWGAYDTGGVYSNSLAYANNEFYVFNGPYLRKRSFTDPQWRSIYIPNATVTCLATHPLGDVFSGTSPMFGDSYYYYGRLWSFISSIWQESYSYSAVPVSFRMVTAAAVDSSGALVVSNAGSIVISSDRGTTWTLSEQQQLGSGELTVNKEGMIFLASGGIFRSTDRGITWDQFNEGMTDINTVSVATANKGVVFVGGTAILYRSSDYGVTWNEVNFPFITGSEAVRAITNRGNRVVVGVDKTGAYFSEDGGANWHNRSEGLANDTINDMLLTPSGSIFAATTTGIYEYTDSAGKWSKVSSDGLAGNVLSLALAADGRLYVGTGGGGVFRSIKKYSIPGTQSVHTASSASGIMLSPNPASSQVRIGFPGERPASFKASIYNLLGERLLVSDNEELLNVSALPSGRYFIRVESGTTTNSSIVVIQR